MQLRFIWKIPFRISCSHDNCLQLAPFVYLCSLYCHYLLVTSSETEREREGGRGRHVHVCLPMKVHMIIRNPFLEYHTPTVIVSNWCHLLISCWPSSQKPRRREKEREGGVHVHVWLPINVHMEEILPSYRSPTASISNWCHLFVYVVYSHYLLTEREGEREKDGEGMYARTYVYQSTSHGRIMVTLPR